MTTALSLLIVTAFLGGVALMLLGYPTHRNLWSAILYGVRHLARFTWAFAEGLDAGLREFRATADRIEVPSLLRPAPSRGRADGAVDVHATAPTSLETL